MAFLLLQPYNKKSLKNKGPQKLAPKFYGPYKILQCIGSTIYKLELPESSKVHPIFHVSYIKIFLVSQVKDQTQLPEFIDDESIKIEPEIILERCIH